MQHKGRSDVVAALILLAGLVLLVLIGSIAFRGGSGRDDSGIYGLDGDRVGLVEVIGPIYDSRKWCEQLDRFRREKRVKSIVVRIDSPGGGVAASQELLAAVQRARDTKPVVVSMGSVAASGGYYAAIGADTIVANPGTTTGSIGVLMELTEFEKLMEKIGIDSEVIKSGEFKDTGWPFRGLTRRERDYLQGYVDDAYQQFLEAISLERSMDITEVKKIADGRIFTGRQAKELGLIDIIGDQYEAVRIAGELAGIGPEPKIVRPPKKYPFSMLEELFDQATEMLARKSGGFQAVQYRWRPER